MKGLRHLVPATIRGQMTVIIVLALLTVIATGRAFERWAKADNWAMDIEDRTGRLYTIAELLRNASPQDRDTIIASARRAGWDLSLVPIAMAGRIGESSSFEGRMAEIVDILFPPDGVAPVGGWRAVLDGRRVIAVVVDDTTLVLLTGFPDAILTDSTTSQGTYYLIAIIVLLASFFVFAIRAITEPIRRISEAADDSDIANTSQIFEERGSIEIVALTRALNGMRSRIRVMVESRTRMLRGIGHDLRTPLTRLRLRAERMEASPTRDAFLSDVLRIDTLLAESLNYLKDDYAIEPVERADIASVLQTVCNEFSDVGFDVGYSGPNKLIANCKPLAITRAISNLCDNGVKFAGRVVVELRAEADGVKISVSDDGPGIPSELRERVFEPFFKADNARVEGRAGFGLGLSIVADIVHAHRGTVSLSESALGGLSVVISIPKSPVP